MKAAPNYHFQGDCEEALQLYARAFRGEITKLMRYSDAHPADMRTAEMSDNAKSRVYHS